jgi:hypothetical protein
MAKMNKKLGKLALEEIRESIRRCTNPTQISAEAERLAKLNGVSKHRIYELTEDIRPRRKTRADKGKRIADLMQTEGLKIAASLVITYNIDPAEALRTAELRGFDIPVELPTFVRYLNEHGLNRKNRRKNSKNFRRFEAKEPGEVFQFDMSGSKERWYDTKTRKIVKVSELEVSKNHPNENKDRVKVWRFVLVDDYSRRRFIRFVAVDKANSSHVVAFLMEAYQELGVPKILYTDNDAIIKGGRNKRASQILNRALEEHGGYKLQHHTPGNARATGKVENAHQWVEKVEKLLGLFLAEGRALTMEILNKFAVQISNEYNHRTHRETGQKPIDRWNSLRHVIRTVDAGLLKSAFLVDEFEVLLLGDLTFKHKGVCYQLPTDQRFQDFVHRQSKKNKVKIIFPDDADFFILIDFDGNEYDIIKTVAGPDTFGEFKSTAEDVAEKTRKELKTFAKENAKAEKELNRIGFLPKPIAVIDETFVPEKSNISTFPKPTVDVTPQILETLPTPHKIAAENGYAGQLISWYDAVKTFRGEFESLSECKEFLDSIFPSRDDEQPETLVRQAVEGLSAAPPTKLRLAR